MLLAGQAGASAGFHVSPFYAVICEATTLNMYELLFGLNASNFKFHEE